MLKLAHSLRELDFAALMAVYREGNQENGGERYPRLSEGERLLRAEQDFYTYLRESFFPTPGAVYAVWETDGRYGSALRLEPYRDGLLLEALETMPELRRRGYAKALIRAVQDWLRRKGRVRVYSHVDRRNTASLAVHTACGFRKYLDYGVYADGSVFTGSVTLLWETE